MRNGQNKRMRGRNRKSQNPLTRVYESNGPDVKIRGTASHIAEKYVQLARDAQSSGDHVGAENYYQHAEHYFRLIAAAQEQFRQANPFYRPENESREDNYDDADDEATDGSGGEQPFGTREPQPFIPREQNFGGRDQPNQGGREQQNFRQQQPQQSRENQGEGEALPAFITGGQAAPQGAHQGGGYNQENYNGQGDRFPLHRRRRRHRGPREQPGGPGMAGEASEDSGPNRQRPND